MQTFGPIHLVIIIAIVVIGLGLIFKGAGDTSTPSVSSNSALEVAAQPARPIGTPEIARRADDMPPPIERNENKVVKVELEAVQLIGEIADGTTYEYWTFNRTVPGPFLRVREGDTVEVSVTHAHDQMASQSHEVEEESFFHSFTVGSFITEAHAEGPLADTSHGPGMNHGGMSNEDHQAAGHGEHSIDLHAVQGALGGADGSRAGPNETKTFKFRADKAGIYVYHCGSPHVATHIANGMYGLILVEPKEGLSKVDREYYLMEGELYTSGSLGQKGHQEFNKSKLLNEDPEYVVFNGRPGALTGKNALTANVGETVRMYVGSSGQIASNFHVIGEVFDRVYREGDLLSPPARNVQTTVVPAGGASVVEFDVNYPGTYLFVDHALSRAIDRGAAGQLIVTGEKDTTLYEGEEKTSTGH
jgi:nitrite reductase (NO-forming)